MKSSIAILITLAAQALSIHSATLKESLRAIEACTEAVHLDANTNIWKTYKLHANGFYRREVEAAAVQISDPSLKRVALKVADIGSFLWM
jgi:cellulose 1,4-beta-cellobiosidase